MHRRPEPKRDSRPERRDIYLYRLDEDVIQFQLDHDYSASEKAQTQDLDKLVQVTAQVMGELTGRYGRDAEFFDNDEEALFPKFRAYLGDGEFDLGFAMEYWWPSETDQGVVPILRPREHDVESDSLRVVIFEHPHIQDLFAYQVVRFTESPFRRRRQVYDAGILDHNTLYHYRADHLPGYMKARRRKFMEQEPPEVIKLPPGMNDKAFNG